jgi:hypothetical protein
MGLRGHHACYFLLLAFLAGKSLTGQVSRQEIARMALLDEFFNKIGDQLIHTPVESRAMLEQSAAGAPTRADIPGSATAINMAKAWARNILVKEFQPPLEAVFLPIRREAGLCDVVRTAYRAGGLELEVAQTFSMFNVTVKNMRAKPAEEDIARAQRVAKLILSTTVIAFQSTGTTGILTHGKQQAPCDPFECDWSELLRWWSTSEEVGFITVKTTKSPERMAVGPGEEANIAWFDFYKR